MLRESQDLLGSLVTVRSMRGVAKEDEALMRKLGHEAPQDGETAHPRVEHPHKALVLRVLLRHAFLPTIPAWNQYATRSDGRCGVELSALQPQAAVRRPKEDP